MMKKADLLYRFHKELNRPFSSTGEMVRKALSLVEREIPSDRITSYVLEPQGMVLKMQATFHASLGAFLEVQEEIPLIEGTSLWDMASGGKPFVLHDIPHPMLYVPLRWGDGEVPALGFLRFERFDSKRPFKKHEREMALSFALEVAQNLYQARLDEAGHEQLKKLRAMTDLAEIFASSLRVEEGVKLILQGIQQNFGLDRVRLYLVDKERRKLRGELSVDIKGRIRSLRQEEIPLDSNHRFANLLSGRGPDPLMEKYKVTTLYLPLTVSGQSIGLLVVENLLSQQPIEAGNVGLLKSFAGQIALAVDNARLFDEVQELSLYDSLTGLPLRRYFSQRFSEEIYRAERFSHLLSLIWIDIDYFKEINDTYGHQVGDEALKAVGNVILRNLRKIDFSCRYGGDEILILLPQVAELEAKTIAQRLLGEIREVSIPVPFSRAQEVRFTASMGIASFPSDATNPEGLLQKADEALYWVKSHGKNAVALYKTTL